MLRRSSDEDEDETGVPEEEAMLSGCHCSQAADAQQVVLTTAPWRTRHLRLLLTHSPRVLLGAVGIGVGLLDTRLKSSEEDSSPAASGGGGGGTAAVVAAAAAAAVAVVVAVVVADCGSSGANGIVAAAASTNDWLSWSCVLLCSKGSLDALLPAGLPSCSATGTLSSVVAVAAGFSI